MLPARDQLRTFLDQVIADAAEQGLATDGLSEELAGLSPSIDTYAAFAKRIADLPLRDDWPYTEPNDLESIRAECDPGRPEMVGTLGSDETAGRIRAAFMARICGCMLGKGFEIDVTLDEIRSALDSTGEWPLQDYPSEAALRALPSLQGQWRELTRERIAYVVPDDDVNYTILAMLTLERHGDAFTHDDLRTLWLYNLPPLATFGPERTFLISAAMQSLGGDAFDPAVLNPGSELCGALIRSDAYGYACLGAPEAAAGLAFRDASLTHRRTGIYGAMFVAAAIACAPFAQAPLDIVRTALRYVPQASRFASNVRESLALVEDASDWLDGYARVHQRFDQFGFCRIHQEIGTVVNTLRFAASTSEGIGLQVMQGSDTDSFGATAGSILGAFYGPGHLDDRFVAPLNDDVRTALASFHERSLSKIADRMAALPSKVNL